MPSAHVMRFRARLAACLIALVAIPAGLEAQDASGLADNDPRLDAGNPYRAIVARNAFRLKDPVPPPPPQTNLPPPPEPPKSDIRLAGLAEIGGVRYAYFMIPDPQRPGQFEYPALTDNPKSGPGVRHPSGLEVREIDLAAQTVRLVNGGIESVLNLKEHGVNSGGNVARATVTGAIPVPGKQPTNRRGNVVVTPSANPPGSTPTADAGGTSEPLIFSRSRSRAAAQADNSFIPGGGSDVVPNVRAGAGNSFIGNTPGQPNVPTRPVRTEVRADPEPQPQVSLRDQYEILVRQRERAAELGVPLPPIPGLPNAPQPPPQAPQP